MRATFSPTRIADPFNAGELAAGGISVAIDSANRKVDGWSDKATALLDEWLLICTTTFLAEDFRTFATVRGLEEPASKRAFGGIIAGAAKAGKIVWVCFDKTANPKAHGAVASRWQRA